jgi:hypothetical protein
MPRYSVVRLGEELASTDRERNIMTIKMTDTAQMAEMDLAFFGIIWDVFSPVFLAGASALLGTYDADV